MTWQQEEWQESVYQHYYRSEILVDNVKKIIQRFGLVKLNVIKIEHHMKRKSYANMVGLDIRKFDPNQGLLFTVEELYTKGEFKGQKKHPGVYHTLFRPECKQQEWRGEDGEDQPVNLMLVKISECERIV